MIQVKNNTQIDEEQQAEYDANKEAQERQNRPIITSLASYVRDCWQASKEAKVEVENRMIQSLRQKRGEYSPSKLKAIQENGGSEIFMMLTDEKCSAAIAWITDILFPADDKPWGTKPTSVPDLAPEQMVAINQRLAQETQMQMKQELIMQIQGGAITSEQQAQQWLQQTMQARSGQIAEELRHEMVQEAKKARTKVETKLQDLVEEAGWDDAVKEILDDIVTFPAGVLKGPVLRRRKRLRWKEQQQQQQISQQSEMGMQQQQGGYPSLDGPPVEVKDEIALEFNRVSPFDIYPLPNARKPNDGIIERHSLTRGDLQSMIGVEGYDDEAIQLVLTEYGRHGSTSWLNVGQDLTRQMLEDRPREHRSPETRIDALQFWGSAQGLMLLEYGIDPERIEDPLAEYQVEVWLIDRYIIKAEINGDILDRVPYHFASFRKRNGSIWGSGVPELINDSQDACNAGARNLINNMGIACLTGDTVVYRHKRNGRSYGELTLDEIWDKKGRHNSGLRRIKLRSMDENTGEFFLNRVVNIYDNGVAPVYEVTTKTGYTIRATGNHRFMSDAGEWRFLDTFNDGDMIAVNGTEVKPCGFCIDCDAPLSKKLTALRCRSCASKAEHSVWNKKQIVMSRGNNAALETSARQRKDCRDAYLDHCEKCGAGKDARLGVHHKDKDPHNNDSENLKTLCDACHKYEHKRHDNIGDGYKHMYLDYDEILSIDYIGTEQVFDLEMEGPHHNFVANGFISHNSGPQVAYDISQMPAGQQMTEMKPWKIWPVDGKNSISGSQGRPPVSFFAPPSMAGELMKVYEFFSDQADTKTGVPKYSYGNQQSSGGALGTASGFSMMMNNATRGIKNVVRNVDSGIIKPSIEMTHQWALLNSNDPEYYVGDIKLIARGSNALIAKEQSAVRRNEFLQIAVNPAVLQVIGMEGLAEILREVVDGMDFTSDDIVPSKEDMAQKQAQAMMQAQQQAQIEQQGGPKPGRETDGAGAVQGGQDARTV